MLVSAFKIEPIKLKRGYKGSENKQFFSPAPTHSLLSLGVQKGLYLFQMLIVKSIELYRQMGIATWSRYFDCGMGHFQDCYPLRI